MKKSIIAQTEKMLSEMVISATDSLAEIIGENPFQEHLTPRQQLADYLKMTPVDIMQMIDKKGGDQRAKGQVNLYIQEMEKLRQKFIPDPPQAEGGY